MTTLETYRNADAFRTAAEQQAQKAKETIAVNLLAEQRKAHKDFDFYMKHIQKKINKYSSKGEFAIEYRGTHRLFGRRWTDTLANLVVEELLKMGFNSTFESQYNRLFINWRNPDVNT